MSDNPRIQELRRRVEKDPASIAFAQLAEEYRRSANYEEAVRVCRAGLEKHPSYLSARVTLGRALIELQQYDDAKTELDFVLKSAPENLAAIRGLAEISQRRGDLGEALRQYRAALAIARHDPDLEQSVHDLARQLGETPVTTPAPAPAPAAAPRPLELVTPPPVPVEEPDLIAVEPPPPVADAPSVEHATAVDDFTEALEALDSVSVEVAAPPPPVEPAATFDLPLTTDAEDTRVVPHADWEKAGFDVAWAKRIEPQEAPAVEDVQPPVAEAGVVEAPVIEPPVVEAPVVEAPVLEAPVPEAPVVTAPVLEAPIEAPVIEAPVIEAPVMESSVIESPVIEFPMAEAPVAETFVDPGDALLAAPPTAPSTPEINFTIETFGTEIPAIASTPEPPVVSTPAAQVAVEEPAVVEPPVVEPPVVEAPVVQPQAVEPTVVERVAVVEPAAVVERAAVETTPAREPVAAETPMAAEPLEEAPMPEPVAEQRVAAATPDRDVAALQELENWLEAIVEERRR